MLKVKLKNRNGKGENNMSIPRPEYPRPQFVRDEWMNLNGKWQFEFDYGVSGHQRGLAEATSLSKEITVPFCFESELSGIGNKDFCLCVWYKKAVTLPDEWQSEDRCTILNIGACDYETTVYVNGKQVGTHIGGYISFSFDITAYLTSGENIITIRAYDDTRSDAQPTGKQCPLYYSKGCDYTRTTGIWQTVWLENVHKKYIKNARYTPDLEGSSLLIEAQCMNSHGETLTAEAFLDGKSVGIASCTVKGKSARMTLKLSELKTWNVGAPVLYDLKLTLGNDSVNSYFGMRDIAIKDGIMLINGKPIFQRLILDQGFYPDGIYTAPTDDELRSDVQRSIDMGYNGARLHEKIFEPRFLYYCDKMGYIVWGEYPNWGIELKDKTAYQAILPEWIEALERDYNHPAIVGWCPLNETKKEQNEVFVKTLFNMTKAIDRTRPMIDTSGYVHVDDITDILDCHDYEQDVEVYREKYGRLINDENIPIYSNADGKPTFVSEFGGTWWNEAAAANNSWGYESKSSWGYGNSPRTKDEVIARYKGLVDTLLSNPKIGAFCYTQLTDVEQEQNGLYTYDRKPKFDPSVIRAITSAKAAIEE